MKPATNKTKQLLIGFAKLLVAIAAVYSLYAELSDPAQHDWRAFFATLGDHFDLKLVIAVLFLAFTNRFLEVLKWQNLVRVIDAIGIGAATRQVLAGMAFGIVTPAGIGEYAGKAFFFPAESRKKIVFLNLLCNGIQMVLSVVFGVFGLLYFNTLSPVLSARVVVITAGITLAVAFALLLTRKLTVKGWSIERLLHKINRIPRDIHRRNVLLAIGRYLSFSHQQYLLLLLFGANAEYLPTLAVIAGVYLLASCLPTFQLLDFAVKGSLSVYFFEQIGVDGIPVLFAATSIWLLNVVIPVVIGSYFVIRLRIAK